MTDFVAILGQNVNLNQFLHLHPCESEVQSIFISLLSELMYGSPTVHAQAASLLVDLTIKYS